MSRRQTPLKRTYPGGRIVWYARHTDGRGHRRSAGTFALKRDAQAAIDAALLKPAEAQTVGAYFQRWLVKHPRSARTDATNRHRIGRLLDVGVEGLPLRDWDLRDLRRRHVLELVDHMLREQARATTGAKQILSAYSAMVEDAITDEVAEVNPFRGVKIRKADPRATKRPRAPRVFDFATMHSFAAAAGQHEALVRTPGDTGMRLGEFLALRRTDLRDGLFHVGRTCHEGVVSAGTKNDHGEAVAGRVTPCPPGLAALIRALPARIDSDLLFCTPTGRLWRERNFYRDVWEPARRATGLSITPHDCRHSYVSHLTAAGLDRADLAAVLGHTVETMDRHYTHDLGRSHEQIRKVIG